MSPKYNSLSFSERTAGILLHPTSLPGPHGMGDLGPDAHKFLKFLKSAGQSWWQMLPVGPPGLGESPYQSLSSFAGNPFLISLDFLVEDGLLRSEDIRSPKDLNTPKIHFDRAKLFKWARLKMAYVRFQKDQGAISRSEYEHFLEKHKDWVWDYALFSALKEIYGGAGWNQWEADVRNRKPSAMREVARRHRKKIGFYLFIQFIFDRQWRRLRDACHWNKIKLMGDVPFYVSFDSVDVWSHQNYFKLRRDRSPAKVAGVPPDYFSETGQLWGNPVYDWAVIKRDKFQFWVNRLGRIFERFDALRLDHFIGFYHYWEVDGGAPDARFGHYIKSPGKALFNRVISELGPRLMVAEDLGAVTPGVEKLRQGFKIPGMRVLQFGFSGGPGNAHFYKNVPIQSVVFTGTHDNDTTVGWYLGLKYEAQHGNKQAQKELAKIRKTIPGKNPAIHWEMIKMAYKSKSSVAIIPLQDILGLGGEHRMNMPGVAFGNWSWRAQSNQFSSKTAAALSHLARQTDRIN